MTTLAVRHTVQDFDVWKAAFDAHADVRRSHGATGHRVLRDGQDVLVLIDFDSKEQAGAFTADPSLKAAMASAGVTGAPDIAIREEAEGLTY
jgi:heme-degrading monooxygenase HmoA